MQETNFYKLRKPDEADFINVEDLNYNADVLDQELNELKNKSFEIVNNLSDSSTDKALSAAQGEWLNENKLTNKKKTLSTADLNNPNYPEPYVCSTDKGKEIGLPTSQAYIQYFRNENDDGFGTQIAYKLDRANQDGDNSKLWTMKIRVASALMWGAWENVATSIPKGHYAVTDLNTCQEDGNHYYFVPSTANKPPLHSDGIVSVYAYNAGNNEQQSFAPYIVQVAHSWWQDSIFMRSGKNGAFSNWKEVLTSNNAAFSVDDAGLHMKKPLFFTATDGSSHTLQELFQLASSGKTIIANAITGKGVPTSTTASWQEMAESIGKIASKLKTVLIERFEENTSPPQYFRVEYGKSGFGSSNGEYYTRLVFTPPKPMRLVALELIRNNNSERAVESIFFGGDWQETIGHLINGRGVSDNQHQAYCVPISETGTISTIFMSLNYDNEIQVDKLHVFRQLGVTSIKITYLE